VLYSFFAQDLAEPVVHVIHESIPCRCRRDGWSRMALDA
jgi:hypothetical protein